jgi:hypothetical protein
MPIGIFGVRLDNRRVDADAPGGGAPVRSGAGERQLAAIPGEAADEPVGRQLFGERVPERGFVRRAVAAGAPAAAIRRASADTARARNDARISGMVPTLSPHPALRIR